MVCETADQPKHSNFPLVIPVRNTKPSLGFAVVLAATLIATCVTTWQTASAQQHSPTRSVRSAEQVARASWSPVRRSTAPGSNTSSAPSKTTKKVTRTTRQATSNRSRNVRQASHNSRGTRSKGAVRQAQHVVRGHLPAPTRGIPAGAVINGGPIVEGPIVDGSIVDGGSILHEGEVIDGGTIIEGDTYPLDGQIELGSVHGGGCDSMGCDGGCDSCGGGCSTGCTTSCGGNCSMCGELASCEAWRPCITLRIPQDGWVSFEGLTWWQKGMDLPPLVTTSIGNNIARADAGVLGLNTTQTLFGGGQVLTDRFDGFRLQFGIWLDRCHTWGLGAEYFNIGAESESFTGTSTGDPILARPFFNTTTGLEDSELVAFPNVVSGTVSARATSELFGGGFHIRRLRCCQEGCSSWLFCGCDGHYCSRSETRVGYRYLQLDENVTITEDLISTDTANPGSFEILDEFDVRNQFNGLDLGWKYRLTRGYWTLDTTLRMAFGTTRQSVRINGSTLINDPANPPPTTEVGGLLAQTSNIGVYKRNEFAVVPEFNLNVGYQLTEHLRAMLGYTFIYWSNVVRPGDQIDTDVNPNFLPPPANPLVGVNRPAFEFRSSDYWVQGLSYGLEYRW